MTSVDTGRRAEQVAADFLCRKGCTIAARNWRTRWCEVDIVAVRGAVAYLCEVKYRRTDRQGSGLEYITPRKLAQMRFAAASWAHRFGWRGEYQLCAIEISGPQFRITAVIKDL